MSDKGFISEWIAGGLPAYPRDEVASVVGSLGDSVLWSGAAATDMTIDALVKQSALTYFAYPAGLVVLALAIFWLSKAGRRYVIDHKDGKIPGMVQVGIGLVFSAGLLLPFYGFVQTHNLNQQAANLRERAYVITATRIVEIRGDSRTDIPNSAVTSVQRTGASMEIRLADRRTLNIETMATDHAALRGALDRVVENAGQGSRVLKDRMG